MATNPGGRGIRLRPLDIGDVLDETFQAYRRGFVPIVTTMALAIVPSTLVLAGAAILMGLGFGFGGSMFDQLSREATVALIGAGIVAVLVLVGLWLLTIAAQLIATGAVVRVASNTILGQPISIRDAYREAFDRFGSLSLASICIGLAVGLLFITCIGIPVAVYLGLGWSLAFPAIMLEGRGGFESLERSSGLVTGHRWRLLVVFILILLIEWLLLAIPGALVAGLSGGVLYLSGGNALVELGLQVIQTVFQTAGQVLFTPIGLITAVLLYYDLLVRKEAFDLQQRLAHVETAQPTVYPPYGQPSTQHPPQHGNPPPAPVQPPYPQQPSTYPHQPPPSPPLIPPPPPAPPNP
jgi:Membrane domain of glycerophosphoryl diester phosphodiesterase